MIPPDFFLDFGGTLLDPVGGAWRAAVVIAFGCFSSGLPVHTISYEAINFMHPGPKRNVQRAMGFGHME